MRCVPQQQQTWPRLAEQNAQERNSDKLRLVVKFLYCSIVEGAAEISDIFVADVMMIE